MEVYGRNFGRHGSQSGHHQLEWSPDLVRGLGFGSRELYPERYGVQTCVYYMRTGVCGFGSKCRYNHPRDRRTAAAATIYGGGEYPERIGKPECQFYLVTGSCKFGASCKFHHPKHGGRLDQVPLNIHGFPTRPGEKECSFYLKTGQCKYGIACKFHHPPIAGSTPATAPTFYQTVPSPILPTPEQFRGSFTSGKIARPPLLPGSYVQGAYGPVLVSPGVVPIQGWNPYSAPVSPVLSPGAQAMVGTSSLYGVAHVCSSTPALAGSYSPLPSPAHPSGNIQKQSVFPERPGQPECQFYLKIGVCKFGSSCRFHHPRHWVVPPSNYALSPLGLPMRPGLQPCIFYLQNGQCKFGASCKFDHPVTIRYSPSASSLTDMPVAPYPIGSSLGTQPPSF